MELGISIDAQESVQAISFLNQWSGILQHVQYYLNANLSSEDINSIRTVVDSFKTRFSYSFHAYGYLNPAEENNLARAAWIEAGKESIDFLSDIGGRFINFHIGYALSSHSNREEMLFNAFESITALCKYAIPKNISIHIENDYSSHHILRLGDRIDDLQYFLRRRPENLYLCFDVGHANISFSSPLVYKEMLSAVQSFHIHNNHGVEDEHVPIGGPGSIDLSALYCDLEDRPDIYGILENDFKDYSAGLRFINERLLAKS